MSAPSKPVALAMRAVAKAWYAIKVLAAGLGLFYVWWLANKIGSGEFLK